MSKIVKAINVMVSNPELITNVLKGEYETECFFKYDQKHLWSILKNKEGDFFLRYYPGNQDISFLASVPNDVWHQENINEVVYDSKELATKEAKESMSDLFNIVNEKIYGMEGVLDDIINSSPLF